MMNWINKKIDKKGFTLIELVVVIAILGILASIAIPRFGGISDTAERRAIEADHRVLIAVVQMFYADTGEWPNPDDLDTDLDDYFDPDYAGFTAKTLKNNGVHIISGTGIVSSHDGGTNEGVDQWSYTY